MNISMSASVVINVHVNKYGLHVSVCTHICKNMYKYLRVNVHEVSCLQLHNCIWGFVGR